MRRVDRAPIVAGAAACAVSLRHLLLSFFLSFRPFDGKSRGLDILCSVPKASVHKAS
jgi:hypothetical protein